MKSWYTVRGLCFFVATLVVLTGCSSDSPVVDVHAPKKDKVNSFQMKNKEIPDSLASIVSHDRKFHLENDKKGNVYVFGEVNYGDGILLKVTTEGDVHTIVRSSNLSHPHGLAVRSNKEIILGSASGIYKVNPNRKNLHPIPNHLRKNSNSHDSEYSYRDKAQIIGVRPDGSVVVTSGKTVWTLKKGKFEKIYTGNTVVDYSPHGAVDKKGNVYLMMPHRGSGDLTDIEVIDTRGNQHEWSVKGSLPGTKSRVENLSPVSLTPSSKGGMYVNGMLDEKNRGNVYSNAAFYLIYIHHGSVKVLARSPSDQKDSSCRVGKSYPIRHVSCVLPQVAVEYKNMILLMGGIADIPGLVVQKP